MIQCQTGEVVFCQKHYRNTDHWKSVRKGALERDGHKCQHCGHDGPFLHVHHLTYAGLGDERTEDLITLCGSCHFAEHARSRINTRLGMFKEIDWVLVKVFGKSTGLGWNRVIGRIDYV